MTDEHRIELLERGLRALATRYIVSRRLIPGDRAAQDAFLEQCDSATRDLLDVLQELDADREDKSR